MSGRSQTDPYSKFLRNSKLLLYILKESVLRIVLIPNIPENNVYFMSYIDSKFQKGNPKCIICTYDSLKLVGDSPAPKPTILKLNA